MENLEARNSKGVDNKVAFWRSILEAKQSLFPWNDEGAGGSIHEALTDHPALLQAIQNIARLLPHEPNLDVRLNTEVKLYKSDRAKFFGNIFRGSLSELIAMEFTMLSQKDLIKAFLERNGFKDVRVERKDNNPYNGRKNVWMISAIRNNQPISQEDE